MEKIKVDSPCLGCEFKAECKNMCLNRLEWGVFEADKQDKEQYTYGNNQKVKSMEDRSKKHKQDFIRAINHIIASGL